MSYRIAESSMNISGFDRIIYLGSLPRAGEEFRKSHSNITVAPFNRIVVPLACLPAMFEKNGALLAEFIISNPEGFVCARSGAFFQKDFPPSPDGRIRFTADNLDACRDAIRRDMAELIKICHSSHRVLFMRYEGEHPEVDGRPVMLPSFVRPLKDIRMTAINELVTMLENLFPVLDFRLLISSFRGCVNYIPDVQPSERVSFADIETDVIVRA